MTAATLTPPTTLTAPAWGSAGCGATDLDTLLTSGIAAWGCRAIWGSPDWNATKGSPARRPYLDLLGDRQDCTVVKGVLRETIRPILEASLAVLRERIATYDYDSRDSRIDVEPVVVGERRADLRVRVAYGYVYAVVVIRDLTPADDRTEAWMRRVYPQVLSVAPAEATEAAEAERVKAEAKREAARAKRAAKRLDAIVRERTAFDSFDALVDTHPDYWPTIKAAEHPDLQILADAFDAAVEAIGQGRRAWRGC